MMEEFENVTNDARELAIKMGNSVPSDALGLAFVSSERIRPGNTLSMLDLSDTIIENRITQSNDQQTEIVYADEFGILKRFDGRNNFSGNDLTISNLFLNKPTYTENININDIDSTKFVHYFYISRYFIAAPPSFPLPSIKFWIPESNFKDLKMSVVNLNGSDYVNPETGEKKYRFLLEPFLTGSNFNRSEVPCRVVVLFDADPPTDLKLVYDKVESDENGNFYNQVLRYSESINAVKYFSEIPEETFVIDPNYLEKQNFSVKKINQKYTNQITGEINPSGYQIITPSKAIKDNRTFEAFNWRLIARTRRNINLDINNYGVELDSDGNVIQATVKVGVLYSSLNNDTSNSVISPYVFHRLSRSPFNLSKYNFINPGTTLNDKTLANYWKIDIDSVDDLSGYDILAWSPTSKITDNQVGKINAFLRKAGTLILDISSGNVDTSALNPQLKVAETTTVGSTFEFGLNNNLLDPLKNGGWEISPNSFEKETYSILGSNYSYRNEVYKSYLTFDKDNGTYADENSFINIGSNVAEKSIGVVIDYPGLGDTISKGSLIGVTFPLMAYCNSIYSLGSYEDIFDSNTGSSAAPDPLGVAYAAVLEGPFKLLYNIVAYGLYSKSKASRFLDFRSSLFNFVTPWNSSWVMDSNALLESEKSDFSVINFNSSTQVYAKDLIPNSTSLFNFYKNELDKYLPENQKAILATLQDTDIEYFIELTNIDVNLINSVKIPSNEYKDYNLPSSYYLFKLNNGVSKLYAFTTKPSRTLDVPEIMGPYTVLQQNLSVSESSVLQNNLSVLSSFKSYPFDFDLRYTYASAEDKHLNFLADVKTEFTATFPAKLSTTREVIVYEDPPDIPGYWVDETLAVSKNAINIKSSIDNLNQLRTTTSSDPTNIYLYSGDIDIHKDPRQWKFSYPFTFISTGLYNASSIYQEFGYESSTDFLLWLGNKSSTYALADFPYSYIKTGGPYSASSVYAELGFSSSTSFLLDLGNKADFSDSFPYPYIKSGLYHYSALYLEFGFSNKNDFLMNLANRAQYVTNRTVAYWVTKGGYSIKYNAKYNPNLNDVTEVLVSTVLPSKIVPYFIKKGSSHLVRYDVKYNPNYDNVSEVTIKTTLSSDPIPVDVQKGSYRIVYELTYNPNLRNVSEVYVKTTLPSVPSSTNHEYVKYIQYTMATVGGQACVVDGSYGLQTSSAVKNFQTAQNQRYKDGTVDSETKSYMAFAWKRLKATNPTLFNTYKANVPDPVITKYITAVENARTANLINGTSPSYKKLTFSGFSGPSTGSDIIWFEIPDGVTTINDITIEPDTAAAWRNFSIVAYGYNSTYTTDIFVSTGRFINTNLSAVSSNPKINMGGITRATARYMWIWVVGRSLSGFGSAEGFSIKSIKINGIYRNRTWVPGVITPEVPITTIVTDVTDITIGAKLVGYYRDLPVDIYNPYNMIFDTTSINSNFYISEIIFTENGQQSRRSLAPEELNIGDLYDFNGLNINFGVSPSNLILDNATIDSVRSQNLTVPNETLEIQYSVDPNSFKLTTSAIYLGDSTIVTVESHLENYRLRNLNGNLLPAGINSVTVNDGVLLICDANGLPFGLLTESDIKNSVENPTSITEKEIDLRYGYMIIDTLLAETPGFIYGFYDVSEREFLGKTVSVLDIYDRGFGNVYVGVCAIDADGNTQNDNEFIGPTVDITFKPVDIPFKYIAPIYSIHQKNDSIIKAMLPWANLTKFDIWELPISSGSFVKKISIDSNKNWLDWKADYKGQELSAVYTTIDLDSKSISNIFGSGYYSVYNEHPDIIGKNSIRVMRSPILSWNHKTNYSSSVAGIIKPELTVYVKNNELWETVPYSSIKDINCNDGIIEFKSGILPNESSNVKVDYTVISNLNLINQIDGDPIPLNPLVSKDSIIFNKPLYIYIKPKLIYKKEINTISITIWPPVSPINSYSVIDEYSSDFLVNFTYDNALFDTSSEQYDPFALPIAVIYVYNNPYNSAPNLTDIRVRGGGFKNDIPITTYMDKYDSIISSWDVYPPSGKAYPKGGYIIVKIPNSVKNHFVNPDEIRNIISSNLTAGIVYELQDLDGNSWGNNDA